MIEDLRMFHIHFGNQDEVIADMRARDEYGASKYGVRHQHDNGRDHLIDAYQEALDLALYLRADIARTDSRVFPLYAKTLTIIVDLRRAIDERRKEAP